MLHNLSNLHSPHGHEDGASPPPLFVFSHSCTPRSGVRVRPGSGWGPGFEQSRPRRDRSKPQILQPPGCDARRVTRSVFFKFTRSASVDIGLLAGGHMRGRDFGDSRCAWILGLHGIS